MISSYYHTGNSDFTLYQGDTFELLHQIDGPFDMIFAAPPYFLEMKQSMEDPPEQVMVLVNHTRPELKLNMMETDICN